MPRGNVNDLLAFLAASLVYLQDADAGGGTPCFTAPPAGGTNPGIASFSSTQVVFNVPSDAKSAKSGLFQFLMCCT